ncbi:helix-turn-helix domain-containing protein [Paenibacillus doosanensis]|uniref:HTH-type transcriptional regulator YesS n=1 Tax=Paenibacillus konkukensis TaxID=2020716 RepID=A0ABY4S0P9_9BACL|nr:MULTISPECIES: helix-turn-helix domain-containing protein [Paenibacillus]MCS7463346.1 helix-turn-helix domain-containing protein [Paenibacillus doosanensis]UQZ87653.1 HTH-type transcriptional regulator YesS [Paenibacillus konkukensis]
MIISSIPGIIVGALVYWMGGSWLENALLQLHTNQIVQRAANIDDQFSYMETSIAHWAFDTKFNSNLYTTDFYRDFEIARDITKTLGVMQGSTPLARQVELYLNSPQPIRFYPEYDLPVDRQTIDSYNRIFSQNNLAFWTRLENDSAVSGKQDLALVHKIPGVDIHPFGALIVRVNDEKAANLIKTLTPYNVGETFIMQSGGDVLVSSAKGPKSSVFDETLKAEVDRRGQESGSFLYDFHDSTYTVSYGVLQRVGTQWTYVSASPIDVITKPVDFISKLILTVSLAALLLACALSWFASRKIYSPVGRLIKTLASARSITPGLAEHNDEFKLIEKEWLQLSRESDSLQTKLEQQLTHVREGFLLQLVQGFLYAYKEEDLLERMRSYGWEVDERQFVMMHIHLTGFTNLEGRFSQGDEGLVTFAAANMIEELTLARLEQADVINFHDLSIGLMIILPSGEPYKEKLRALSDEIIQAVNRILKLQVSIAIGKASGDVEQIPSHYEDAKQALSYRNFENENQIIDLESLETEEGASEPQYPFLLEREVIQMIRTGQRQETEQRIASFLDALLERGAKEIDVQQGMLQLLGSILHAIRQLGMDPSRVFKSANLYEQLTQIREPAKMLKWFNERIVEPFMKELEARSDAHLKKVVESAMIYLQNHYMKEVSLDTCADFTGMNAVALSKAFKLITGKNFIDYLTELRMEKAKELLRDTELKINDVAVSVGYQHSYFNRIFKKHVGYTPSHYREISRGQ